MAITLVATVSGIRGSATTAIDTTGASLLVASTPNAFGPAGFSDNKSNTWLPLTVHVAGIGYHGFFYCLTPIVGTGHTFTPTGTYASCIVYAFAGVAAYESESGNGINGDTPPVASGPVTPTANGALIITGLAANTLATDSVSPAGFTQTTIPNGAGVNLQNSAAYLVQAVAATINPTWSWTGGSHDPTVVSTAVFAAAVVSTTPTRLSQLPIEVLRGSQPLPSLRISQLPIEVLRGSLPAPALRLSQLPIEILRSPGTAEAPPTAARLSQLPLEVLRAAIVVSTTPVRVSQLPIEILRAVPPAPILVTQLAAELLSVVPNSPLAVTQLAAEIVYANANEARVTQLACELIVIVYEPPACSGSTATFPIDPDD
jgi:hypothetical protein